MTPHRLLSGLAHLRWAVGRLGGCLSETAWRRRTESVPAGRHALFVGPVACPLPTGPVACPAALPRHRHRLRLDGLVSGMAGSGRGKPPAASREEPAGIAWRPTG